MAFLFSLAEVFDHRVTQEEQRQREFAEALGRVELARAQRARIEDEIRRRHEQIRREQKVQHFAMRELTENWILAQRAEGSRLDEQIRKLAAEAEQRRLVLIEAMKARKVLEELRDKEAREHRQAEARLELKSFDEIATRDYVMERNRAKAAHLAERIA